MLFPHTLDVQFSLINFIFANLVFVEVLSTIPFFELCINFEDSLQCRFNLTKKTSNMDCKNLSYSFGSVIQNVHYGRLGKNVTNLFVTQPKSRFVRQKRDINLFSQALSHCVKCLASLVSLFVRQSCAR